MTFAFEKLLVYQKAIDFADHVCCKTENFPRGYGFLVDLLNRAALSIAANIAEGNGRFTNRIESIFSGLPVALFKNVFRCWNSRCGANSFQPSIT